MRGRRWAAGAAAVTAALGLLATISGCAYLVISVGTDLPAGDEAAALAPLAAMPLEAIEARPFQVLGVAVPATAQWRRIRRAWGEPELVVSAVWFGTGTAYCLAELGLAIEARRGEKAVALAPSGPRYGYSTRYRPGCGGGSLRVRNEAGANLLLTITRTAQGPLPPGELVVECDWPNLKDKLVGASINEQLHPYAERAMIGGIVLMAVAAWVWRVARRGPPAERGG